MWRWFERCLESSSALDTALLQDAIPEPGDRKRLLAVLLDRTLARVEGLHLTQNLLDARVVDETLPLLAVLDSVDLLDLPGYFSFMDVEHLSRHQVVALLSCVLLSISEERRQGWCRLVGFTIESDMLKVAGRLWDVHTLKSVCDWECSVGYQDRENVVEVGVRRMCCGMVSFCFVASF